MSVAEHRGASPDHVTGFVLTISDTRTADTDEGGQIIATMLEEAGHRIAGRAIVKDDPDAIVRKVRLEVARGTVDVVITTGGTGFSRRDSTPDTLAPLFDKTVEGFGELFRMLSFEDVGPAAMLSRATAGVIADCVVFVLPGSPKAVHLAMERLILPELGHLVGQLRGSQKGEVLRGSQKGEVRSRK